MNTPKIFSLLILLTALPAVAQPDLTLSTCSRAYVGPETAVLFNLPDGGGSAFTEASIGGITVDATITLTVLNAAGDPVTNYPSEDLWLESVGGGMMVCPGGANADSNTDAFGQTSWVNPLFAGGYSQELTQVYINGAPLQSSAGLLISYNSPDINGDLVVNLLDLVLFAQDFFGAGGFRSDLYFDNVLNLSDIARLGQNIGVSCP